ncbi:efflux RND transporter periplasmic adaptor subunit [Halothiobacillus sp.]|jgi:RND family efflux transporter MFP subunit|uniref:efflux RND transporter periplasmic adaptor subunit n=1 Tax=Halothiobacillus sp. TaxID=1891311 RepID=UPI002636CA64|nr:efflux RND transporter periplasmic adaptor subunit [Halothiobacillus sp.]MDD3576041.1 efflux RND transporter periplasmic adaptor subunit [Halothiobacillus sp.]MDD4966245.1 efflux RND transporter periplasmic adaptor subunit [Halothiobacillus sp.]MDY0146474.1 efflux RND transporter periplasmic adaptor subunit [Halothiobacillus sp.]
MSDHNRAFAKKTVGVAALLAIASVLSACGGHDEHPALASSQPELKTQAELFKVQNQSLPVFALFPGSVITSDQISISSRVMGYVRSVDVHEGQTVKSGDTLLTIDSTDVTGAINQAQAAVNKAWAALADAKNNYERYANLYKENAVPKQMFEQMQTAYKVAQSNYSAAIAGLKQAKSQLTYVKITAPFSGTITSRSVDPGQMATPGLPLMTLQGSGQKQVEVQLSSQAFATLKLGDPVTVRYTDFQGEQHQFQGTVERMVDATDPVTHTHTVKIGVPENVNVRSGNYVIVQIAVAHETGMLVPLTAIHDRGGIRGVFVLDDQNRAWFRMVRLGHVIDGKQVILSGLVPGERLVTQSDDRLQNGIVITNAPAAKEQPAS